MTSSFFEFGRLARLGGRDGESRQSTEAIYLLPEHCRATQDPMAHLRMGGGMHRRILRVGPETDRYCAEIARAGDKTAVGRSSGLLLEFRARVNKPWEDLLVSCRSELMHPSGLGLWAWLVLDPTILIGLLVGLGAALFFFLVLGALLDPWLTRRVQQQQR